MIESGIYAIRNRTNRKRYVGQTIDLEWRWRGEHLFNLRQGCHFNLHLQNAFNLYGEEAFEFVVLEYVEDLEMLTSREQHYIDLWWSLGILYNICPTAGSTRGRPCSEQTRYKMSEALRGRPLSEETCRKMSEAWTLERRQKHTEAQRGERNHNYGKHPSEEHRRRNSEGVKRSWIPERRRKQSEAMTGQTLSEETRCNISEALTGKNLSEDHRNHISEGLKRMYASKRRQKQVATAT